jgi:hypothetical protein
MMRAARSRYHDAFPERKREGDMAAERGSKADRIRPAGVKRAGDTELAGLSNRSSRRESVLISSTTAVMASGGDAGFNRFHAARNQGISPRPSSRAQRVR